jgi:isoaspartyl peptidase/L-asparaginase-like protein (Ntn-hydrolase superfamily)
MSLSEFAPLMSKDQELTTSLPSTPFYVVAAHGGAGYHPPPSDSSIKRSLRAALSSALAAFSQGGTDTPTSADDTTSSALDITTKLIAALEDDPDFNAGYGSNLTFDGDVECDAALMDSGSCDDDDDDDDELNAEEASSFGFGGVGAVRGVRNPILLARRVLENRRGGGGGGGGGGHTRMMSMRGRVPPLLLVGEGAVRFAREVGVQVVREPEEMVASRARQEWRVWKGRWEQEQEQEQEEWRRKHTQTNADADADVQADVDVGVEVEVDDDDDPLRARLQDTVGAVVLVGDHHAGDVQVSAGVSRCVFCVDSFAA